MPYKFILHFQVHVLCVLLVASESRLFVPRDCALFHRTRELPFRSCLQSFRFPALLFSRKRPKQSSYREVGVIKFLGQQLSTGAALLRYNRTGHFSLRTRFSFFSALLFLLCSLFHHLLNSRLWCWHLAFMGECPTEAIA